MITETTVKYLWADEGKWLTDGEVYAKAVKLADGRSSAEFSEITDEEYNEIRAREMEDLPEDVNEDMPPYNGEVAEE